MQNKKIVGFSVNLAQNYDKLLCKVFSFTEEFRMLQHEILLRQVAGGQLGGAGRHPFQRVVPEGPAVGTGGHDPLFRADHLVLAQLPSPAAVGAAGFY